MQPCRLAVLFPWRSYTFNTLPGPNNEIRIGFDVLHAEDWRVNEAPRCVTQIVPPFASSFGLLGIRSLWVADLVWDSGELVSLVIVKICHLPEASYKCKQGVNYYGVFNYPYLILLVFSVTPFKIDQNKNENRPIESESGKRKKINMQRLSPRFWSIFLSKISGDIFYHIYRDLFGDAILIPFWMYTNFAAGNQQKHRHWVLLRKRECISRRTQKH